MVRLVAVQIEIGFAGRDAFDQPDPAQHAVKGRERIGGKLHHQVPFAVGGVYGRYLGHAAQPGDDPLGAASFNRYQHDAAHRLFKGVAAQDDAEAEDLAGLHQFFKPGADRGA